jgi:hypothetical protein
VGIPIPKVDSFSCIGERRYLAGTIVGIESRTVHLPVPQSTSGRGQAVPRQQGAVATACKMVIERSPR